MEVAPIQYKWEKGAAYLYEGTVKFDFSGESPKETEIKSYFCVNPAEAIKYPEPAIEAVDRGMAFPLDHKGHFITVEPAVRDVTDANLSFSLGGTSHSVKRIAVDAARGLALLKVEPNPAVMVPQWKMVSVGPTEEFFVDHPGLFDYVRGERTWEKKSSAGLNSDPHDTLKKTPFYRVFSAEPLAGAPCLLSGTGFVIGIGYAEIPPQETGSVIRLSTLPPYGVIPTKTVSAFLKEHKLELPLALGAAKSEMPGSSIAQLLERKKIDGVDPTITQRNVLIHSIVMRDPGTERTITNATQLHRDEFGRVLPPEEKHNSHLLHFNPRSFYDEFLAELPRRQGTPNTFEEEFPIAELRREDCFFASTPLSKDLPEIIATNQKLFVSKADLFDSSTLRIRQRSSFVRGDTVVSLRYPFTA